MVPSRGGCCCWLACCLRWRHPRLALEHTRALEIGDGQSHRREDVGPGIDVAVAESFRHRIDAGQESSIFTVLGSGHGGYWVVAGVFGEPPSLADTNSMSVLSGPESRKF